MRDFTFVYKMYVMVNRVSKPIAQFCARLFVCWLLLVPNALSFAAPNSTDLSILLCSPSGQPLNASAEAALRDLSILLGETDNETVPPNGHCEICTLSFVALPPIEQSPCAATLKKQPVLHLPFETGLVHKAQGPPSGSRAPPTSI